MHVCKYSHACAVQTFDATFSIPSRVVLFLNPYLAMISASIEWIVMCELEVLPYHASFGPQHIQFDSRGDLRVCLDHHWHYMLIFSKCQDFFFVPDHQSLDC